MRDLVEEDIVKNTVNGTYPRGLRNKEREFLEFVLPFDRPGYKTYRELIESMVVLGSGRRGNGNFILGYSGDTPDTQSPLASVVAYGAVESTRGAFTITVREFVGKQIDVEIVSTDGDEAPEHFEEKRRWTYSLWTPGNLSPATGAPVREILVGESATLAIASADKRIWVHEAASGMLYLIPITNFYNELMLHKNIRDPKIALQSKGFFREIENYSDHDLRSAFIVYNKLRPKVTITNTVIPQAKQTGSISIFQKFFAR